MNTRAEPANASCLGIACPWLALLCKPVKPWRVLRATWVNCPAPRAPNAARGLAMPYRAWQSFG
jgi:hypothetical protein